MVHKTFNKNVFYIFIFVLSIYICVISVHDLVLVLDLNFVNICAHNYESGLKSLIVSFEIFKVL